jgi:hypothetical protein
VVVARPEADVFRLPRIPRLRDESAQRGQVQYLAWRLDMYLKDHGAPRADRKRWMQWVSDRRAEGAPYDEIIGVMEVAIGQHLQNQFRQIQAIYNERGTE